MNTASGGVPRLVNIERTQPSSTGNDMLQIKMASGSDDGAENGSIRPGDLLVTSGTRSHAMRDSNPPVGTVIGKALASLSSGTGVIEVLVTLQ